MMSYMDADKYTLLRISTEDNNKTVNKGNQPYGDNEWPNKQLRISNCACSHNWGEIFMKQYVNKCR